MLFALILLASPLQPVAREKATQTGTTGPGLKVLFLGDQGHHQPALRYRQLAPLMANRGIRMEYTESLDVLDPKVLAKYDALAIYANHPQISPTQEKALVDWVEAGGALVPLHCASYCFLNSPKYIALVGGQFKSHGTGTFRVQRSGDHPLLKDCQAFESWDETYVHTKHNPEGRVVLETRLEKGQPEPWTWLRTQGKGRVFYTAWGHDQRTFSHEGFASLVERGIRWAAGATPEQAAARSTPYVDAPVIVGPQPNTKPFEFQTAKVPFYPAGERWGTTTEPVGKMQKPLDPAESARHLIHPGTLEPVLFATEENIPGKPIAMNWDERGRLWVVCTIDYPNEMQPKGKGRDKLVVVEDTDNDGKADKTTVFAEGLSIPTSLTFANGGVIIHQAPETLFLKDTDGDGKADVRQVIFSGWSTGDTHAGPSNLQWGLDNWLYGMVGYSGFRGEVAGKTVSFATGLYRFKADGSALEFLRNTSNNSWGVGFSEEGLLFGGTANGCPIVFLPIPNRYYEAVKGWSSTVLQNIAPDAKFYPATDKVRQVDWHGQFTSAAGSSLYTARRYPREYWNRTAFVCEPTGHLAATFVLDRQGAGFSARYGWNLLASDDEWTAPIVAEVGPDGCMWVIDWYNYIVQHNPTPAGFKTGKGSAYETPLRDKKLGRIYRLVPKGTSDPAKLDLSKAAPEVLVATLGNDNLFWRRHAQRLLVEKGSVDDTTAAALIDLVKADRVDATGLATGAMHALWVLHGTGRLGSDSPGTAVARMALTSQSAGLRRAAIMVLPGNAQGLTALLESGRLTDSDAQVRLAALLRLAELPVSAPAGKAIAAALADGTNLADKWLADGLTAALAKHNQAALAELMGKKEAAKAVPAEALRIIGIVAEHQARQGDIALFNALLPRLENADPVVAGALMAGWDKGWPRDGKGTLNAEADQALVKLFAKLNAEGQASAIRLAEHWNSASLRDQMRALGERLLVRILDDKATEADRLSALAQVGRLISTRDDARKALAERVGPRQSPAINAATLEALAQGDPTQTAGLFLPRLGAWPPTTRTAALKLLVARPDSALAMLTAMDKGDASYSDLALDQKQALASHPNRKVADIAKKLLARGGGLPNPDREKVVASFEPLCKESGDAAKGKAIYTKHCSVCHKHSGQGGLVGPDLTGMAAHPKQELLIHILDPNRSVEGNFRLHTVSTADGRVLAGLLASETKTTIELVDAQGKRFLLPREDIEEFKVSSKSIMPEGFEKQVTREEFSNLLEFLTQRGQYLPLPLDKAATTTTVRGMFFEDEGEVERLVFPQWKDVTFEGVPFHLIDPQDGRVANAVLLYGPNGKKTPKMPKRVTLPCNSPARAIHFLSGISGWGFPYGDKGAVSLIVRLKYADGKTEDQPLKNGEQFADYIRRVDVPGSKFAFDLQGRQLRYFSIIPGRADKIDTIELIKGPDSSAPIVMAVTVETR